MNKKSTIIFLLISLFSMFLSSVPAKSQTNGDTLFVAQQGIAVEDRVENVDDLTISQRIDNAFTPIVDGLAVVLFWDPFKSMDLYDPIIYDDLGKPVLGPDGVPLETKIPLVVIWLIFGAVTFSLVLGFINFRGFKHAILLIKGVYDNPKHKGEVTHFQALTTALSATVGLGNIAGVAVAISIGGPGAAKLIPMALFPGGLCTICAMV